MDLYYDVPDLSPGSSKTAAKKATNQQTQRANLLFPYMYYEESIIPFYKRERESSILEEMGSVSLQLISSLRDLMVDSKQSRLANSLNAYLVDIQEGRLGPTLIKDVYMLLKDFYRNENEETWGCLVLGLDLNENVSKILEIVSDQKKNSQPRKTPTNILGIPSGGAHRAAHYNCLYLPIKDIVEPLCHSNREAVQSFVNQIIEADKVFFPDGIRGKSSETLTRMLKTSVKASALIDHATKNKMYRLLDGEFVRSIVGILNVENLYNLLTEVLKLEKGSANEILNTPAFDAALSYVSDLIVVYKENAKICESLDDIATKTTFGNTDPFPLLKEITFAEIPTTFPFISDADQDFWVCREVMARLEAGQGTYSLSESEYDFSSFPEFVAAYCTKHPEKSEIPLPAVYGTVPFSTLNKLTPKVIAIYKKDVFEIFSCLKSLLLALNNGKLSDEFQKIVDTVEAGVEVALDSSSQNQDSNQQLIKIYNTLRSLATAVLEMEKFKPVLSSEERDNLLKQLTHFPEIKRKTYNVNMVEYTEKIVDFLKMLFQTIANNYMVGRMNQ